MCASMNDELVMRWNPLLMRIMWAFVRVRGKDKKLLLSNVQSVRHRLTLILFIAKTRMKCPRNEHCPMACVANNKQ